MISPIRILAVDDHALLRRGIAAILASQPDISLVAEASNGREAVDQHRTHRPDITLMDLQMPEMNGLDAMVAILAEFPDARIIMLTTYVGDVQVLRAMRVGARGYLLKTLLDKELLETIRAVQTNRRTAFDYRRQRQRSRQEYSLQTRCDRQDPRRDDRRQARHYPVLRRFSPRDVLPEKGGRGGPIGAWSQCRGLARLARGTSAAPLLYIRARLARRGSPDLAAGRL